MHDGRIKHAWLRALGAEEMPVRITLADGEYLHQRTFKHDFFAATGLYAGPSGRVVLKIGRCAGLFGIPMRWFGRWLVGRELTIARALDGLPGVPRSLGRWNDTGLVRAYVDGHPLQRHEWVDDEFFPQLEQLIDQVHRRGIAYVDLEKDENILVNQNGHPFLIDFQISWHWPVDQVDRRSGLCRLIPASFGRFLLAKLQAGDRYHLLKHRRRHRPDGLTREQIEASYRRNVSLELHRRLFRPLTLLRRAILKSLTGRSRSPKQV